MEVTIFCGASDEWKTANDMSCVAASLNAACTFPGLCHTLALMQAFSEYSDWEAPGLLGQEWVSDGRGLSSSVEMDPSQARSLGDLIYISKRGKILYIMLWKSFPQKKKKPKKKTKQKKNKKPCLDKMVWHLPDLTLLFGNITCTCSYYPERTTTTSS